MSYTLLVIEYKGDKRVIVRSDVYEVFGDGLNIAKTYTEQFERENRPRMKMVNGPIAHCGMYTDMYIDSAVILAETNSKLVVQAMG